jgi:hypothetical protein
MQVDASYVTQTVTITFDERHLSEETVRHLLRDCGFACGEPMTAEYLLQVEAESEREHDTGDMHIMGAQVATVHSAKALLRRPSAYRAHSAVLVSGYQPAPSASADAVRRAH